MIKRTIEISSAPARLSVRHAQLQVERDGMVVGTVPCEDIGTVVVDQPQTVYTHPALTTLAEKGAVVVLCGRDHLPAAMVLPLGGHSEIVSRLHDQLNVSKPTKKQLWKQLIQAKIRAQGKNLGEDVLVRGKLLSMARRVRSGDPENVEAQAARIYWAAWSAGYEFRRDPDLPGLNSFLNYGYAIVRAALGRAIVSGGLLPALGIHHHNRSNPFCLADDLIEPLRPLVDERVLNMHETGYTELTPEAKGELLEVLAETVRLGETTGPLMVQLHRMVASLVRCYRGEAEKLEIPERVD